MKQINLLEFRGRNSDTFTGRPEGESARTRLRLDDLDRDSNVNNVEIIIPSGTAAFNPSFFLGLFFKSIKKLKIENFEKKYKFKVEDEENRELYKHIRDGIRQAINSLDGKSPFDYFINKI